MAPFIDKDRLLFGFLCWRILHFLDDSFIFCMVRIPLLTNGGFGHWFFRDFHLLLHTQVNWERRRKNRVFIDEVQERARIKILDRIGLQHERNLCTSFQSFTPRVWIGGKIIFIAGRAKDVLLGIWVFGRLRGNRSDEDLISDQKTGQKSEDERLEEEGRVANLL